MQLKLIAIGLVLAALGGLLWHDHYVTRKLQARTAELNLAKAEVTALKDAAAKDARIAEALQAFRTEQATNFRAFDEKLKVTKFTREVRYETKDGEPVVCVERIPAVYRRLHNEAVSGAAPAGVP